MEEASILPVESGFSTETKSCALPPIETIEEMRGRVGHVFQKVEVLSCEGNENWATASIALWPKKPIQTGFQWLLEFQQNNS